MWAAGYVDGDGCIRYKKKKISPSGRNKNEIYRLQISVTSVNPDALENLMNIFNFGNISLKAKAKNNNCRDIYVWSCGSNNALIFCKTIYPYVVCKKDEIELILNNQNILKSPKGKVVDSSIISKREDLYKTLKFMKTVNYTKTKITQKLTIPWLAGFFDAEGCIYNGLQLSNTDLQAMKLIIRDFNPQYIEKIKNYVGRRPIIAIGFKKASNLPLIKGLIKHSVTKKLELALQIALYSKKFSREDKKRIKNKIKEIKHKKYEYDLTYGMSKDKVGKELLIRNYD